jgi:hypothetical protein
MDYFIVERLAIESKDKAIVSIQADSQNRFYQAFVTFKFVSRICNHAVWILSFDVAHIQHTRYNGVLLMLVASNSNGKIFVIAFNDKLSSMTTRLLMLQSPRLNSCQRVYDTAMTSP